MISPPPPWPLAGWEYVAEGGANVVVTHPSIVGSVLRLAKRGPNPPQAVHRAFLARVLGPRLAASAAAAATPLTLVDPGELLPITPAVLTAIAAEVAEHRPPARLHQPLDTTAGTWAWKLKDRRGMGSKERTAAFTGSADGVVPAVLSGAASPCAAALSTTTITTTPVRAPAPSAAVICVELKPKCGYLSLLSPGDTTTPLAACRFCTQQRLRHSTQRSPVSRYCPLDLFSTELVRVDTAIANLLETPQNNLRIFAGRTLLYDQGIRDRAGRQLAWVEDALLRCLDPARRPQPPPSPAAAAPPPPPPPSSAAASATVGAADIPRQASGHAGFELLRRVLSRVLCETRVLDRIRQLQRGCISDVETVRQHYDRLAALVSVTADPATGLAQMDGVLWSTALQDGSMDTLRAGVTVPSSHADSIAVLQDFACGMTANDCSVMFSLHPVPACHHHAGPACPSAASVGVGGGADVRFTDPVTGTQFTAEIGIVDGDLKRTSKIISYVNKTLELAALAARTNQPCAHA